MKPLASLRTFSLIALFTLSQSVLAQTITKLTVEKGRVAVREDATVVIDYQSTKTPWCGISVAWGNGDEQDIRIGDDDNKAKPLRVKHSYPTLGTFTVVVTGRSLRRGLFSASECEVAVAPIRVTVVDPVAEDRDRRQALEQREAAERQRAAMLQAEIAQKELEIKQKDIAQRELDLKRKELELREAALRREEESRRAASVPVAVPVPPKAAPIPKPVAPAQKPEGF